jgi:hypothetical protein
MVERFFERLKNFIAGTLSTIILKLNELKVLTSLFAGGPKARLLFNYW